MQAEYDTNAVKQKTLKSKLDNILIKAYFLDSAKFSNYKLSHVNSYSTKYCGEYRIADQTIVIQNDLSGCNELFLASALHELSHHIEYIKYGYTKHDDHFYQIYRRLLYAAFALNIINASKLSLAEKYLSYATDRKYVAHICNEYMNHFEVQEYQIEFTTFTYRACEECGTQKFRKAYGDSELWYRFQKKGSKSEFIVKNS